jgi:serine/threonine protein kinase
MPFCSLQPLCTDSTAASIPENRLHSEVSHHTMQHPISRINIGQTLRGRSALFKVISVLRDRPEGPWLAMYVPPYVTLRYVNLICSSGSHQERVTVKTAPPERLNREAQMLQLFQGHDSIRQLVDQIEDPESVILEYMDDYVLSLLKRKQLPKVEAKRALKATFKALTALHDKNIVHTGTLWGREPCPVAKPVRTD